MVRGNDTKRVEVEKRESVYLNSRLSTLNSSLPMGCVSNSLWWPWWCLMRCYDGRHGSMDPSAHLGREKWAN